MIEADGPALMLQIQQAAAEGALVALLVDRSVPGQPVLQVPFLAPRRCPDGAVVTAAVLRLPVVLGFGLYHGGKPHPEFEDFCDPIEVPRASAAAIESLIRRYAARSISASGALQLVQLTISGMSTNRRPDPARPAHCWLPALLLAATAPLAWAQAAPDSDAIVVRWRGWRRRRRRSSRCASRRCSGAAAGLGRIPARRRHRCAKCAPYAETTTLRDGRAVLARQGGPSAACARARRNRGPAGSFGALLSGDAEALRRHYTVESEGDAQRCAAPVPRDDRLAAKLRELRLHGRGDELRCIENAAVQARCSAR